MIASIIYKAKQCDSPRDSMYQWDTLYAVHAITRYLNSFRLDATEALERYKIEYLETSQLNQILDKNELKKWTDIHLVDPEILFPVETMQELKDHYQINFHLYGCDQNAINIREKLGDDFFTTVTTEIETRSTCLQVWQGFNESAPSALLKCIHGYCAGIAIEDGTKKILHRILQQLSMPYRDNIFGILSWIDEIDKYSEQDFSEYIRRLNES